MLCGLHLRLATKVGVFRPSLASRRLGRRFPRDREFQRIRPFSCCVDLVEHGGSFQLVTGRVWRGTAFGGVKGRTELPGIVEGECLNPITVRGAKCRSDSFLPSPLLQITCKEM